MRNDTCNVSYLQYDTLSLKVTSQQTTVAFRYMQACALYKFAKRADLRQFAIQLYCLLSLSNGEKIFL